MQFMDSRAMYVAENNLKVKELLQKDAKYKEVFSFFFFFFLIFINYNSFKILNRDKR